MLSMMTQASWACATSAIAGTSWISNDCEPGDSVNIALVFGLISASIPAPILGVVIGRLDPHPLQGLVGEGAGGAVGQVRHQEMIAGAQRGHQRNDDRRQS